MEVGKCIPLVTADEKTLHGVDVVFLQCLPQCLRKSQAQMRFFLERKSPTNVESMMFFFWGIFVQKKRTVGGVKGDVYKRIFFVSHFYKKTTTHFFKQNQQKMNGGRGTKGGSFCYLTKKTQLRGSGWAPWPFCFNSWKLKELWWMWLPAMQYSQLSGPRRMQASRLGRVLDGWEKQIRHVFEVSFPKKQNLKNWETWRPDSR